MHPATRAREPRALEFFILCTALGVIATLAAPWLELRGTFAAWRLDEWNAFWRGANGFLLAGVVGGDYQVPVEFATRQMQTVVQAVVVIGGFLALWHTASLAALLVIGARARRRSGAARLRVAVEVAGIVLVYLAVLWLLVTLLALPSTLTPKVDFRGGAEVHTDSLVWSSVTVLLIAPAIAALAALGSAVSAVKYRRYNPSPARSPGTPL
ncbi:MAG: hypothetical protein M1482_02235 [Chloroflexi bacterium]|nr:hypothetical protein [Chloroflexota bacterium]